MKKLYFLAFLLGWLPLCLLAQEDTTSTRIPDWSTSGRADYTRLDPAQIPRQLLYDHVRHYSRLGSYNGSPDTTASAALFRQLHYDLHHMQAAPNTLLGRDTYDQAVNSYKQAGLAPLGLLNMEYGQIKPNALADSLIGYDSLGYYHLPNPPQSPFQTGSAFAFCAFQGFSLQGSLTFMLPDSLIVSNRTGSWSYEVDFADGLGYRALLPGQPLQVTYADTGTYTLRFRATQDSTVLIAATIFRVMGLQYEPPGHVADITATIPVSAPCGYTPTMPYASNSAFTTGRAYYRFGDLNTGNNPNALRKPIIFVEGIDFPLHTEYRDGNIVRYGDFGWDVFITGQSDEFPQLVRLPMLLDSFKVDGHDVILLDFRHSADLIQKNAMLLVKLIQLVNSQKADPTEEIIVMGASMGTLVSRYALAYMEQQNLPHCTRLWASFDGPHLGANIPQGAQFAIELFSRRYAAGLDNRRKLQAPASLQMLVSSVEPSSGCYRQNLLSLLASVGQYPQLPRRVAIANGSNSSLGQKATNGQVYGPGATLIDYEEDVCDWAPTQFFRMKVNAYPNSPNAPANYQIFTGKIPNSENAAMYYGGSCCLGGIWHCLAFSTLSFPSSNIHLGVPCDPWDSAPGGILNAMHQIEKAVNEASSQLNFTAQVRHTATYPPLAPSA